VVSTGLATINYIPSPRNNRSAFFTFTTTTTDGVTNNSIVRMSPDLRYTNDQVNDYMLAAGGDGRLYQISPNVVAENLMLNYDGTPVGLTNLSSIAMDVADNLLFYTQTTSPNTIRVYDFSNQVNSILLTASAVSAWTAGAVIADLCFCDCTGTLYAKGDTTGSRILGITIRPYNHVLPVRFDIVAAHLQPFTLTGGITFSVTITENYDMYFAVRPSVGNSQLLLTNRIGSSTGITASLTPESNNGTRKIMMGASGLLYCYSAATNILYRSILGNSLGNGFATVKTLAQPLGYRSFTRSPYGILVI
jgi:hypothetical protein